jgi:hypothetical protein
MVQVRVHRCLSHGEGHIRQGGDCYNMCTTSVTIGHVISGWDGAEVKSDIFFTMPNHMSTTEAGIYCILT